MDLRDDTTPETLEWQATRVETADRHLSGLDARAEFERRVAAGIADARRYPVIRRGARWFQRRLLRPDADQPVVAVLASPTGAPRVLVDPNELSAQRGAMVALVDMWPSPDGRFLAYAVAEAGTEINELGILDVETGEVVDHGIEASIQNFTWRADSTGFWYSGREVIDGRFEFPLRHHRLGEAPGTPLAAPAGIMDPGIVVSPDDTYAALRSGNTEQRLDWIIRDGEVLPFLKDVPGGVMGEFHGDDLIAIVDDGAPRGRLVRIPVATAGDTSTWIELLPESSDVLRKVGIVDDVIVLGYLRDAASGLRILDRDGSLLDEIDLGEPGSIGAYPVGASHPGLPMFVTGEDEVSFVRSTFGSSWAIYRYVVSERRLEVLAPAEIERDDLVISTVTATSSDGAEVLAHVVHRADVDRSVPQPTLVYGYGGFCLAFLPAFDPSFNAWIDAGGVFVLTHLRGGSEFGADWWRQGTRDTKQLTFDDLYAVAEQLVAEGWTTTDRLVVKGESNGGLLTGVALVQRPDLWAAVVSDVPLLDLLEYHRDPLTYAIGRLEYGDPLDETEAEWLRAISPVHNVRPADYPATLVTGGANDPRCPVWHVRLFVDALESAQNGEAPILLKVYADQGHGAAGLGAASAKHADWLAFAAFHAGLRMPQPAAVAG